MFRMLLVGAAVLVYLGKGATPRIPWFVLILAAGSVVVPVLRAKQLFISPTFCVLYALSFAVWINGGRKRAAIVFSTWLVVLVGLSLVLGLFSRFAGALACSARHGFVRR